MARKLTATVPAMMNISAAFDAGNIIVNSINTSSSDGVGAVSYQADLEMRQEPFTEGTDKRRHHQWFYFRASNVAGSCCTFSITNAGSSSYPAAWPGTWAVVSADRKRWIRAPTTYEPESGVLEIKVSPTTSTIWVAYFAPFSYEQHQELISKCQSRMGLDGKPMCAVESIGTTVQGRDIELLTTGTGEMKCWFIARQHPGESMAEWWMQGFLDRLLDPEDDLARKLCSMATFYVVPNMNPDGAILGHLRTNAKGANLNREWADTGDYKAPTLERSPEVYHVLERAKATGVDFWVDVHGDEELPHIFLAPEVGTSTWTDRSAELYRLFCESQLAAYPAFQLIHGYGNDKPGEANLAICGAQIANRFDCLATTLEMPYKDTLDLPEPVEGWSPQRCEKLGASMLDAMYPVVPYLRAKFPFNNHGIGDGLAPPEWVKAGYENPPSEHVWDTTKPK